MNGNYEKHDVSEAETDADNIDAATPCFYGDSLLGI